MWADRESLVDLINIRYLVSAVVETVTKENLLPSTVGVFGDWGSGKSTLMAIAKQELKAREGTVCISFDGSLFEGYEDAKAALMAAILEEVRDSPKLTTRLKTEANNLLRRVDLFRLAGFAVKGTVSLFTGEPTTGIAALQDLYRAIPKNISDITPEDVENVVKKGEIANKQVAGLLKPADKEETGTLQKGIRDFHKDFARLLEQSKITTLVVFIDELDRCMPDTVLETLQAIRLFLAVPKTAFVIGADERLIEHAVRVKFPIRPDKGYSLDVGRHYLEKIIHHPIRIPPLSASEVTTYMNLLFTSLHVDDEVFGELCQQLLDEEASGFDVVRFDLARATEHFANSPNLAALQEDLRLVEQIAGVLATILDGNPRQTKRFLNILVQRLKMAELKKVPIKRRVLAKLMLLEYFRLTHFKQLADWQAAQSGKPNEIALLESPADGKTKEEGRELEVVTTEVTPDSHRNLATWQSDNWLATWLSSPPRLEGEDLRPYFYFAREKLRSQVGVVEQMSPQAREVLDLLISQYENESIRGQQKAKQLSEGDAAIVMQALMAEVRLSEDLADDDTSINRLLTFVEAKNEQLSELCLFLKQIPPSSLRPGIIPRLQRIALGTKSSSAVRDLFIYWSQSDGNPRLKEAAEMSLRPVR